MATTTNFSWATPDDSANVKDGAAAIRSLGTAVDTTMATMVPKSIVDAKGDIIAATAADTVSRLAVGANGTTLVADSAEATGLKWATPAGGGKVLQVVSATTTSDTTIASNTYTDTSITATITPTLATSKILILIQGSVYYNRNATGQSQNVGAKLLRGATSLFNNDNVLLTSMSGTTAQDMAFLVPIMYLDSPSTTSSTTYKLQGRLQVTASASSSIWQHSSTLSTITLLEIGA